LQGFHHPFQGEEVRDAGVYSYGAPGDQIEG